MQNYLFSILILLYLTLPSNCGSVKKDWQAIKTITVADGGKSYSSMMYLNSTHWTWGMIVRENTLNDTAKIGIMEIPPLKIGSLFKIECFVDSIPFNYHPYKATKGKLVIEYYSRPY